MKIDYDINNWCSNCHLILAKEIIRCPKCHLLVRIYARNRHHKRQRQRESKKESRLII